MSPRCRLRIGLLLIFVLLNAFSFPAALGQTPAASSPQQQRDEVLRINTELVQTDVLVLDKSGKAVPGLTREQFELLVDGQPVPIQFFENVEAGGAREAARIAAARGGSAASAVGARLLAETGRTFVFYIDDLHLSQSSVQRTRELLNKFIDGLAVGDQMLIISPSGQIGFLQQLTDNKTVLKMAASRVVYQSQSAASGGRGSMSVYEARAIDRGQKDVLDYKTKEMMSEMGVVRNPTDLSTFGAQPGATPPPGSGNGVGGGVGSPGSTTRGGVGMGAGEARAMTTNVGVENPELVGGTNMNSRRMMAEQAVKTEARRVLMHSNNVNSALLSSLEALARGSASVPGRKLIFLVSDGFVLDTKNNDTAERLRRVIDTAARSGAVFYAIDSKGLSVDYADSGKDAFADIADLTGGHNASIDMTSMALQESTAAKEVLRTLSAETGGRAILNRNDLEGGVGQVVRETGTYYLLAWRPQPETASGQPKFKTIKISVKGRPELRVLSRGGFYTQPPPPLEADAKTAVSTSGPAATKAAEADLRTAVTAPFPRGQLAVAAYTAVVNDGGSYKATGLADLSGYQAADGKGDVDFVAVVLDSSGKSVSSVAQNVKPPSDEGGAKPFRITAKMPNALAPGLYQMRVAARDARTGRVGSVFQWIEIPEFKPGKMTLSSMFLTEESAQGGGGALEVERRFARASNLLLQFYVYNAARSAAGQPDVTVALNILQGGKVVVGAPAAPLPAAGDPARIQYSVSFPLGEFPPGSYALQVVVEDRVAKSAVTQQMGFTVE